VTFLIDSLFWPLLPCGSREGREAGQFRSFTRGFLRVCVY